MVKSDRWMVFKSRFGHEGLTGGIGRTVDDPSWYPRKPQRNEIWMWMMDDVGDL